jgi:hypothetical protein
MAGPPQVDPVLRHARREAAGILVIWVTVTLVCCLVSHELGYIRPDRLLGAGDLRPILGMPRWFFWGVTVPWVMSGAVSLVFAGFAMADDDLGADHASELEADIRAGGPGAGDV